MSKADEEWEVARVKALIWKRLCESDDGKFDFAPLLFDVDSGGPSSLIFSETVDLMKRHGYVTDNRPNYGHYWVKLNGNGQKKCKEQVGLLVAENHRERIR